MTMVSVITIVRDDPDGLVGTARSVFSQRGVDYEYLVKDGASGAETLGVVANIEPWLDWFSGEPDDGIYDAMNLALEQASGAWVAFMNAGDRYLDEKSLASLVAATDSSVDIVYGPVIEAETGQVHPYRIPREFYLGMTFDHQGCIVRRSALNYWRFRTDLRIAGDLELVCRLRRAGASFASIDVPVAVKPFRQGASSSYVQRFSERLSVLEEHFGGTRPVRAMLTNELRKHVSKLGAAVHPSLSVDRLLQLAEALEAEAN